MALLQNTQQAAGVTNFSLFSNLDEFLVLNHSNFNDNFLLFQNDNFYDMGNFFFVYNSSDNSMYILSFQNKFLQISYDNQN